MSLHLCEAIRMRGRGCGRACGFHKVRAWSCTERAIYLSVGQWVLLNARVQRLGQGNDKGLSRGEAE